MGNISRLIDEARASGAPLMSVQHSDAGLRAESEERAYVPDLVIAHTNRYWGRQKAPGRAAGDVDS